MANTIDVSNGQDLVPDLPTGENWMYCRYSDSDKQDGRSIEQQVLANREAGAKSDIHFLDDGIFADAGVEGWKEDRPALNHLRELIRSGRAKCKNLFVFELARLSRDMEFSLKLQKFFKFHGITVHFVADGMVSGDKGFKLIHGVKAVIAETFLDTLSENTKRGHANQFEKGYYAHAKTFGFDHVNDIDVEYADMFDQKKYRRGVRTVINPSQAAIVRLIGSLYRMGYGYHGIARYLNELGVKSPRRPTKHAKRLWGESSVRTILHNPIYTGLVRFSVTERVKDPETKRVRNIKRPESEWRTAQVESLRIISDEEFEEIKRIRKSRDTRGEQRKLAGFNKAGAVYPWSGVLACKECGGPMNIYQGGTYFCRTAFKGGGCSNNLKLNRESFHVQMLELMSRMLREARSFDTLVDDLMVEIERQCKAAKRSASENAANRDAVESKLADVNRQLDNVAAAMCRNPDSETLDTRLRQLEAEKKVLIGELGKPKVITIRPISREEVSEFLSKKLESLHTVLGGDLHGYRDMLRKRVGKIFLQATTFENAPAFEVHGDLRLFTDTDEKWSVEGDPLQQSILRSRLDLTGLIAKLDERGKVLRIVRQPAGGAGSGELLLAA